MDLATYLRYRLECDGVKLDTERVEFEDFLAFLDLEHYLGLAGSDTWSRDGNETQVLVKTLIGQILTERTPPAHKLPQLYYNFAQQLGPGDVVLTFNYDTVLERAMEHVGRPYRLFPSRYEEVQDGTGIVDSSYEDEMVLLKLHGSVDWFDRTSYSNLERSCAKFGSTFVPLHPIFGPRAKVQVEPILEGPQFDDDPLRTVYRVFRGLERFYADSPRYQATPYLLRLEAKRSMPIDSGISGGEWVRRVARTWD